MFTKILLAFDGSDHALNALKTAATLAKEQRAALHVVHTPQVDTPPVVIGSYVSILEVPPTKDQILEAGQHIADLARSQALENGVSLTDIHLCSDGPARDILKTADEIDADLIVMGRRGLGAIGALALGSVSQSVAHSAKCACLTVA